MSTPADAVAHALTGAGLDPVRAARAAVLLRGDPPPSAAPRAPLRFGRAVAALLGGEVTRTAAGALGWVVLGSGALAGRVDPGWLLAWALLLVTGAALQADQVRRSLELARELGLRVRRRTLRGSLAMDAEALRTEGPGALLGRVQAADRLEELGVGGGLAAALTAVELAVITVTLAWWAPAAAILLGAFAAAGVVISARLFRLDLALADRQRALTSDLTEKMTGHRTRLIQEPPDQRHRGEAEALAGYLAEIAAADEARLWLTPGLARAWRLAGLGVAAADALRGAPVSVTLGTLALVQLAGQGLERLAQAAPDLSSALVAWRELAPVWQASGASPAADAPAAPAEVPLVARGLRFGWRSDAPVLRDVDLTVAPGDRVLIDGPSGGGKSTLVHLLGGLLTPTRGVVLAGGLDHAVLGAAGWRRRVVVAPQFQHNHLFGGTLAFNLLLGRRWPADEADLADALAVCHELGLGPLLERMPGGLFQFVGETGWQLSHGERSRVFLARALLSGAPVVILDETFAALDAATVRCAVDAARARAVTLIVVAHP